MKSSSVIDHLNENRYTKLCFSIYYPFFFFFFVHFDSLQEVTSENETPAFSKLMKDFNLFVCFNTN